MPHPVNDQDLAEKIHDRLLEIDQQDAGIPAPDAVAREERRLAELPVSELLFELVTHAASWVTEREPGLDDGSGAVEAAYLRRILAILVRGGDR